MPNSVQDIRLFIAVYEELSFTVAAKREHSTQSGVSQHVRKMEEELGTKLFFRGSGSVSPTPAGETFYLGCVDILRRHERLRREMQQFSSSLEGEIVVGLTPTMTRCALAPALAGFSEAHPNVVVHVVESYSSTLTQQVRAGDLAFAIVPAATSTVGLRSHLFLHTTELLVSGRPAKRDHLAPVRPSGLGPLKLVLPRKLNSRRSRIETYLAANGVAIERSLELDSVSGTIDYVSQTDWVTVLPAIMMANDIEKSELTINALVEPALRLDLIAIEPSRTLMSQAAEAFLDTLREKAVLINNRVSELLLPSQIRESRETVALRRGS
ncbi:MAG: transcriptional regulator, LysR family [Herminiimonas sp.]|nr:transcriptional regulator, LysR family [Herminiimonas sp.]MDB5855558.1 transcriptional regulator, LysR family [Herminiimonas sp.]